jgi:uncharacterized membrane protein affecting hemolysin expression
MSSKGRHRVDKDVKGGKTGTHRWDAQMDALLILIMFVFSLAVGIVSARGLLSLLFARTLQPQGSMNKYLPTR